MNFSYTAWGSGAIIVPVLKALAVIGGSTELTAAILVAALAGMLLLSTQAAFNVSAQSIVVPIKMSVAIVIVVGVLLIPTTVTVTDRFDGQELLWPGQRAASGTTVVSNVPFGIAMPSAIATEIGSVLTKIIETSLSVVDEEDRLSSAGMWLSARALRQMAGRDSVGDSTLASDFRYFLENCTYFDMLAKRVSLGNLKNGPLLSELGQTSGGLTSIHSSPDGGEIVAVSCDQAWNGSTNPAITGLEDRITEEGALRKFKTCQRLRGIGLATSEAELLSARQAARTPTTGIAATCGDNVFAHAMKSFGIQGSVTKQFSELVAIGLLQDGAHLLSAQDPRSISLANLVASRQRDATFVVAGELAAVALPALRGILEAVILMLLPVVLVMGMLFFERVGSYLKNALVLVVWLHIWPPVMAVINTLGQWIQQIAMREHVILGDGSFSLAGVEGMLSEIDTQLALSRYLLVLVPMISWALVRSGEMGVAMLANKLMAPGEQSASSVAGNVATNNWKMDQVQLDPRTSVGPHVATVSDSWGGSVTQYEQMQTMSMPANQPGYVAATQGSSITEALSRRSEESRQESQQMRKQLGTSIEQAYESAFGTQGIETLSTLRQEGVSDTSSLKALHGTEQTLRDAVSKQRTVGQHESSVHSWDLSYLAGIAVSWPFKLDSHTKFNQQHDVGLSEHMKRSYDSQSDESRTAMEEVSTALQRANSTSMTTTHAQLSSDSHKATMREATQDLESYSEAVTSAEKMAKASEYAKTSGQSVMHELAKDPHNAPLLAELHNLHNAQDMPFDQAWPLAQQRSGVQLDLDAVADRILSSQLAPMPSKEGLDHAQHADMFEENKQRVQSFVPAIQATPNEIIAADQNLVTVQKNMLSNTLPPTSDDFYEDERAIDYTVRDENGDIRMIISDESLYIKGDHRFYESLISTWGLFNYSDKKILESISESKERVANENIEEAIEEKRK